MKIENQIRQIDEFKNEHFKINIAIAQILLLVE